jgi:hypothetical protein
MDNPKDRTFAVLDRVVQDLCQRAADAIERAVVTSSRGPMRKQEAAQEIAEIA